MGAGKEDEYLEINAFLEEMISIIDQRLKRQEKSIARLESEIKRLKGVLDGISKSRGPKIDKTFLKILRQ
jgi:hypothetical protein